MTSIDMTHAPRDAASASATGTAGTLRRSTVDLSPKVIDQAVHHGRRLRSQAFAGAVTGLGRWLLSTGKAALGRRATTKLGCGECGDMMRA